MKLIFLQSSFTRHPASLECSTLQPAFPCGLKWVWRLGPSLHWYVKHEARFFSRTDRTCWHRALHGFLCIRKSSVLCWKTVKAERCWYHRTEDVRRIVRIRKFEIQFGTEKKSALVFFFDTQSILWPVQSTACKHETRSHWGTALWERIWLSLSIFFFFNSYYIIKVQVHTNN